MYAIHLGIFPGVIKVMFSSGVSLAGKGRFWAPEVEPDFPADLPAGRSQNTWTTYTFDRSEHASLRQTYKKKVGHIVTLCLIPTFCVPQVDLAGVDLQNLSNHIRFWPIRAHPTYTNLQNEGELPSSTLHDSLDKRLSSQISTTACANRSALFPSLTKATAASPMGPPSYPHP